MYQVGIDVGSSSTKYCVMGEPGTEPALFLEQTPLAQKTYFAGKLAELREAYGEISVVSCGYGKKNVAGMRNVNELTALARGSFWASPESELILYIGGQDTKVIRQEKFAKLVYRQIFCCMLYLKQSGREKGLDIPWLNTIFRMKNWKSLLTSI